MAPLSPADIPLPVTSPSPNPADSSDLKTDDGDAEVGDLSLPAAQKRHLMEIESSFRVDSDIGNTSRRMGEMPPPPLPVGRRVELDGQRTATADSERSASQGDGSSGLPEIASEADGGDPSNKQTTPDWQASSQRERSSTQSSITAVVGIYPNSPDTTDEPGNLQSSPTAAAHARNLSRGVGKPTEIQEKSDRASPLPEEIGIAIDRRPSAASSRGARGGASKPDYGALSAEAPPQPASRPGPRPIVNTISSALSSTSTSSSFKRRSKFLRRTTPSSQHSSVSSASDIPGMDDDGSSTITAGEERTPLSRQASLGSIASGITAFAGASYSGDRTVSGTSAADRALARLDEEERLSKQGDDEEMPETPKDRAPPQQPSDTVITAQIKNIHIPATLAREYSGRLGAGSPSKKAVAAAGTPGASRGREMTLKEQTASIDRLQKENFDLKIKVYYLNEKLEKFSDEGVKEALQENVDMKVKLAEGMRERKSLKKRVRELEKKIEELGGEKQKEEEEAAAETEEIWELRERVERYEAEVEEYRRRHTDMEQRMREVRRQANGRHAEEEIARAQLLLLRLMLMVCRNGYGTILLPKPRDGNPQMPRISGYERSFTVFVAVLPTQPVSHELATALSRSVTTLSPAVIAF
jgi:hypothetical protein